MNTAMSGIELIAEERKRQVEREGFDIHHDSEHGAGELVDAALCYAAVASATARGSVAEDWPIQMVNGYADPALHWPWAARWWKPSDDPIRNLVKAGALIAAEIDRLQWSKNEVKP